jgi:hypothetical protein
LYCAIAQSSGYGKSRLLIEAGKKHLNTVYTCVRTSKNGYPRPSSEVLYLLTKTLSSLDAYKKFICHTYFEALKHVILYPSAQNGPLPLSSLAGEDFLFATFWDKVVEACQAETDTAALFSLFKLHQSKAENLNRGLSGCLQTINGVEILSELVIVLDEARSLIGEGDNTAFRMLRKALRDLGSLNVIVIFTDTISSITNFVPSNQMDASLRYLKEVNLLPPYYEIQSYDALEQPVVKDTDSLDHYRYVYSFGRPVWNSNFFQGEFSLLKITEVVNFARMKLTFSRNFEQLSSAARIAVLALRFGIRGVMDHSLASELMSSYMGTGNSPEIDSLPIFVGFFMGEDRLRMVVRYPPEPVLGEAACQALHGMPEASHQAPIRQDQIPKDHSNVKACLQEFVDHCVNGLISAGENGEVIARCILSLAYDQVKLESFSHQNTESDPTFDRLNLFSRPIKVSEFLEKLISSEYVGFLKEKGFELTLSDTIKNGRVSFTGWAALESFEPKGLNDDFLGRCFHKRVALMFPTNQKGVDLLIVVELEDGTYTFIIIQIKNRDSLTFSEKCDYAGKALKPENCFSRAVPEVNNDGNTNDKTVAEEVQVANVSEMVPKVESHNAVQVIPEGQNIKSKTFCWDRPYIALYMDIGLQSLNTVDSVLIKKFAKENPGHIILLGFDAFNIARPRTGPLFEMLSLFHRRHVEPLRTSKRHQVLANMDDISFHFVTGGFGCNCKVHQCQGTRCGCVRLGQLCREGCNCKGCKNKVT